MMSSLFRWLTFPNVPPGVLDGGVAVDVGEQTEAEAVAVVGGICEAVDENAGGGSLKGLANAIVQLIVNNGAPVLWFLVGHRLHICTGSARRGSVEGAEVREPPDTEGERRH